MIQLKKVKSVVKIKRKLKSVFPSEPYFGHTNANTSAHPQMATHQVIQKCQDRHHKSLFFCVFVYCTPLSSFFFCLKTGINSIGRSSFHCESKLLMMYLRLVQHFLTKSQHSFQLSKSIRLRAHTQDTGLLGDFLLLTFSIPTQFTGLFQNTSSCQYQC